MKRHALSRAFGLLSATAKKWNGDNAPRLGAALSYYTVFSLAPLLTVVIAIAGMVFGRDAVEHQLVAQLGGLIGEEGAQAIQTVMQNAAEHPTTGVVASVIGIVALLLGAAGVFTELQDDFNLIWEVAAKKNRTWKDMLKQRFFSFAMVIGVGFLLLVSLVISAGIAAVNQYLGDMAPGLGALWHILNLLISFGVVTALFALMFKVVPDVKNCWRHVWLGAAVSSILFGIGKLVIGLYLGHSSVASVYGAAGSLVVLMLWVYYSAQILIFGAELCQVQAKRSHDLAPPEAHAVRAPARKNSAALPRAETAH